VRSLLFRLGPIASGVTPALPTVLPYLLSVPDPAGSGAVTPCETFLWMDPHLCDRKPCRLPSFLASRPKTAASPFEQAPCFSPDFNSRLLPLNRADSYFLPLLLPPPRFLHLSTPPPALLARECCFPACTAFVRDVSILRFFFLSLVALSFVLGPFWPQCVSLSTLYIPPALDLYSPFCLYFFLPRDGPSHPIISPPPPQCLTGVWYLSFLPSHVTCAGPHFFPTPRPFLFPHAIICFPGESR